jgi:hypothetical protein
MAFIRDDEFLKAIQQGQPMARPSGVSLGPVGRSSGSGGGASAPIVGSTGAKAPLLADYLKAAQGSKMAETVAGGLERQAERLKGGTVTTGAQGETGLKIQTGVAAPTQERQAVIQAGIYQRGKPGPIQDFTGPGYEAPRVPSLGSATLTQAQAQKQAETVESKARAAGLEGGAQSLLQQQYGKGQTYTQGEQMLDAAILGNQAGGRLGELSKKYSDLYSQLGGRFDKAASDFAKTQSTMLPGQTRTSVSQQEIDEMNAFREAQRARKEDEAAEAARKTRQMKDRVPLEDRVGTISQERQAAMMGMTLEQWIAAGRPWS